MKSNKAIGIFDSGLGGLTVVSEIRRLMPNENIIYLGDTARFPYGNKSRETIVRYSLEITDFLLHKGIKMIIIACNTASALGLDAVKKKVDIPVLGVIEPGAKTAVNVTINRRIGVIGTRATITSSSYSRALMSYDSAVEIYAVPTPLLVPLAEEGWHDSDITKQVANIYLQPLKDKKIDTLILGCTHYPLLKKALSSIMGQNVTLVDSAEALAIEALKELQSQNLIRKEKTKANIEYYTTDAPQSFIDTGHRLVNLNLANTKQVSIP